MMRFRRYALLAVVLSVLLLSGRASAQGSATPSACPYLIPSGATVYVNTGEVYLHGTLIATYPPGACDAPPQGTTPDPPPPGGVEPDMCTDPDFHTACTSDSQCTDGCDLECDTPEKAQSGWDAATEVCCGLHLTPCTDDTDVSPARTRAFRVAA
jgi:hypothetical protein